MNEGQFQRNSCAHYSTGTKSESCSPWTSSSNPVIHIGARAQGVGVGRHRGNSIQKPPHTHTYTHMHILILQPWGFQTHGVKRPTRKVTDLSEGGNLIPRKFFLEKGNPTTRKFIWLSMKLFQKHLSCAACGTNYHQFVKSKENLVVACRMLTTLWDVDLPLFHVPLARHSLNPAQTLSHQSSQLSSTWESDGSLSTEESTEAQRG